ncbi:dicarboxylate/amino acid:cation symporter [Ruminococcus sp. AF18-22]|nr:dicarboxylate/amino acid:cation symporter [Ruminococcus sp. AF18-22]
MQNQKSIHSLARRIVIALVLGIIAGFFFIWLRETLNATGNANIWNMINSIFFQDISAEGASNAIGLFYIIGQMFIRALQLVIIPMIFTSIALAIGTISDTRTLGRISFKTIAWFLLCYFFALLLAGTVGMFLYRSGLFSANITGLSVSKGSVGSNPLLVILNAVPLNITAVFSDNTAVLAVVFLAVAVGLCMNVLGKEKTNTLSKLFQEINDIVVVFLNFVVTKMGPFAIFALLSRTFATYGIHYLRPALIYVVTTVILLLTYLFAGYSLLIRFGTQLNPIPFIKKISKVAMFGFSTSSSAATLPLNLKTTTTELGVDEKIASFVLPLGMTINMNGTAILQVIATLFIAGCSGSHVTVPILIMISVMAMLCSAGTPAAPGAGAIVLFTILSGVGFTNDAALLAYSLILAINRPIEMLVTSLNTVGDSCTCIYVAKTEGLLNKDIYNSKVK